MHLHDPLAIAGIAFVFFTIGYIYTHLASPLRSIPGPFLARFSRLWYFLNISGGRFEHVSYDLHAKHGKIVRIAPNQYSISDPAAVKTIYKPGHGNPQFRKADCYSSFEPPHQPNIFSERDPATHDQDRKKLHLAYTMSTMTSYEKYVDDCVGIFCRRMKEMSEQGKEVNMAWWMQCFAFDVIGEVTYSKRFGFLDRGEDQNSLIQSVHDNTRFSTFMGIFPEWYPFVFNAIGLLGKLGLGSGNVKSFLLNFSLNLKDERQKQMEKAQEEGYYEETGDAPKDFLTKFLEQHQKDPSRFTLQHLISGLGSNVNAGSDTTGITLSAITYYLVKNPSKLRKLQDEIEAHEVSDPITFKETQSMEYLQAVIKEALRLHPAVGVPLARVVPQGGAVISGQLFPAETVVGMTCYVLHHDKEVYGDDVEEFRPERWLKSENDADTLARMENSWFPFGIGSRLCLGKNVSMLEISKLIPQLMRKFDFETSEELERDGLKTTNEFFVLIDNLRLRVSERQQES